MHESGVGAVVVAAEEVVLRLEHHVGGRHGDVRVDVDAVGIGMLGADPRGVVDVVVGAVGAGEGGDGAPGVVGDVVHVGGEERLVLLVRARGDVRPPEEGLHVVGAVVQPRPELDEAAVGGERDAVHPFHAREGVVVAAPDRHGSVVVGLDVGVGGQEGGGPVVLRPVELDAAGDPRAGEPDERRLDDGVAVEEVVVVDLVVSDVDAPAQLGQDHEPHPGVLEVDRLPRSRRRLGRDGVDEGQRVDPAARPLVDAAVEEHGVLLGFPRLVGGDREGLAPHRDTARGDRGGLGRRRGGERQGAGMSGGSHSPHRRDAQSLSEWPNRFGAWTIL